jgi:hypothetical protein
MHLSSLGDWALARPQGLTAGLPSPAGNTCLLLGSPLDRETRWGWEKPGVNAGVRNALR